MIETKVYKAGPPLQGQWVLQWKTNIMPAPAFWYYDTEQAARDAERRIRQPYDRHNAETRD